jgi:CysZ protein
MLRLTVLTLLLNLLALPVYLLLPGINLFLFLALNGYLLGREYFEVVAQTARCRGDQGSAPPLWSAGFPGGL